MSLEESQVKFESFNTNSQRRDQKEIVVQNKTFTMQMILLTKLVWRILLRFG